MAYKIDVGKYLAAICGAGGLFIAFTYGLDAVEEEQRKVRLLEMEELRNDREIETLGILKSNSELMKKSAEGGVVPKTKWWWPFHY